MSNTTPPSLAKLRQDIDRVDAEILRLIGQRQTLVNQVVLAKVQEGLPARIPERVDEVISGVVQAAPSHGVSPDLARVVWTAMVEWFIGHEERMMRDHHRSSAES